MNLQCLGLCQLLRQAGAAVAGFPNVGPGCMTIRALDAEFVWDQGLIQCFSGLDANGCTMDILGVMLEIFCVLVISGPPDSEGYFRHLTICDLFDWTNCTIGMLHFTPQLVNLIVPWPMMGH